MPRLMDTFPAALFHALDSDGDEVIVTTADEHADGVLYVATSHSGANLHREDVDALIEALAPYASDAEDEEPAETDHDGGDDFQSFPEPPLLDPRRVAALIEADLFSPIGDVDALLRIATFILGEDDEPLVDAFSFDPEPQP